MVFHCRCFSFPVEEEEAEEIEHESRTETISTSTQTFYTASSDFSSFAERPNNPRVFSFAELREATNNFCSAWKIGDGRYGSVYKGVVKSLEHPGVKIQVAVKYTKRATKEHKDWLAEVNSFGVFEHPNLVKCYCAEDDESGLQRLLVYEYMPNRSVRDHLYARSETSLSWMMRQKVAQDAARGLAYLHEGKSLQILCGDFNSSKLLLDDHWNAKLSIVLGVALQRGTDQLLGTMGYAAPEYIATGHLYTKSDVWNYGVFLYELITGRHPLDPNQPFLRPHSSLDLNQPPGKQKLLVWVRPYTHSKELQRIIDPRLEGMYSMKSVKAMATIANLCLKMEPKFRPKMSEVLEMVNRLVGVPQVTTRPAPPLKSPVLVKCRSKLFKTWFKLKTANDVRAATNY